eukprot:8778855-Alexandrium_andersonii.AAC.1
MVRRRRPLRPARAPPLLAAEAMRSLAVRSSSPSRHLGDRLPIFSGLVCGQAPRARCRRHGGQRVHEH